MYRRIRLTSNPDTGPEPWALDNVRLLVTHAQRLRGFVEDPVMFHTRSMHTFTMRLDLHVVILNGYGEVVKTAIVEPRRVIVFTRAMWVVEARNMETMPTNGTAIVASTMQRYERHTDSLRDADRQP